MPLYLHSTALAKRLEKLQTDSTHGSNVKLYLGAVEVMLDKITPLLSRIVNTFPHYTSHSVDHSITIVDRISRCLPKKTLNALTPTEIYIIIAGALLHDIGMLVAERDYAEIEALDTFKALRDDGRFRPFFEAADQALAQGDLWAAAFNRRYLIAEWVRRRHADRSAEFVLSLPDELAAARCNDEYVAEAISKVCRAHGFTNRLMLEDEEAFPRDCLIRNDQVDLAFCAVLVRMGDLLDLGHERACPLVRNIAEPLPGDSSAHWGRHKAVKPPTISSQQIRIVARCDDQEQHAILHSWCEWLREEALYCAGLVTQSNRFVIKFGTPKIDIQPKVLGSYEFRQYRFELDHEEIFDKLFGERLYGNRCLFVRELLQNAIDATRCKLMDDINKGRWDAQMGVGDPALRPRQPRDVPRDIRLHYPISISLAREGEDAWRLAVEDRGTGMDHERIQNYLLKAGRSFYRSTAFKTAYNFRPISEFGIGILSCFMVAETVEIETFREDASDGPISLTIPPWRQYLLSRPGRRKDPGTRVSLKLYSTDWLENNPYKGFLIFDKDLGRPIEESPFGSLIQSIIRHIEFPVEWDDGEKTGTIYDPWEVEPGGPSWMQLSDVEWVKGIDIPQYGIIGRLRYKRFDEYLPTLALSKEGIACTTLYTGFGRSISRTDLDSRGSAAPPLTVDRLRLAQEETQNALLYFDYLGDEATLRLIEKPDSPLARFFKINFGDFIWAYEDVSSHMFRVWVRDGNEVRLQTLAEAVSTMPDEVVIKIESAPGRGAADCTSIFDIVLPLLDKDAKGFIWGGLLRIALNLFDFRIVSINGRPVTLTTPKQGFRQLKVDTGKWAAVSLDYGNWVLSEETAKQLEEYGPFPEETQLRPTGAWYDWGPAIHRSTFFQHNLHSPPGMYLGLPPEWARLQGAAVVMTTLRQHFPNIPDDFITDEQIPPENRERGLAYDYARWVNEGLMEPFDSAADE